MTFIDWLIIILIVISTIIGHAIYDFIKWGVKDFINWIGGDK